jgi:hypothetical protein
MAFDPKSAVLVGKNPKEILLRKECLPLKKK